MSNLSKQQRCAHCEKGLGRTSDGFHRIAVGKYARCGLLPPYEEQAPLTSNQRFKAGEMLFLYFDGQKLPVAESGERLITVQDADLDIEQATQLRDWLNSVLPSAPETSALPKAARSALVQIRRGPPSELDNSEVAAWAAGLAANALDAVPQPAEETSAVRAGVSVKDSTPPQEIVLCAAMGPSGFICERPKDHPGRHCDGDNTRWDAENGKAESTK